MSRLKSSRKALKPPVWTESAIRAVTPYPKPQAQLGDLTSPIDSVERSMLRTIAETANLIDAGVSDEWRGMRRFWLPVPAPADLIDFLATFEVDLNEDLGVDDCREADSDDELDGDDEPDSDDEPELCEGGSAGPIVTEEQRARYRENKDRMASTCGFRSLRVPRRGDGVEKP